MLKHIVVVALISQLVACSWLTGDEGLFRDRKKDYRKVVDTPRMEVPAGYDTKAIIDLYPVPPLSIYADEGFIDDHPLPPALVGNLEGAVKIHKVGEAGWVLLQSPPSLVWPRLNEFLTLNNFAITLQNGGLGIVEARDANGVYRFKIEQGFQRNTSEIYVRNVLSESVAEGFWPSQSADLAKEQAMIGTVAEFFASKVDKTAYSFAAQGISTNKRLVVNHNAAGTKILSLYVAKPRLLASLRNALESADFAVESYDESTNSFRVQYLPQIPEGRKPGFWARLFGIKPKPYDEDVEYAGNYYQAVVSSVGNHYTVSIQSLSDEKTNRKKLTRELNKIVQLIKGHFV